MRRFVSKYRNLYCKLNTTLSLTAHFRKKRAFWVVLLLLACVASRIATTIYYVEDIDCLRFALSASHYSILELRPHFPGYALYCFLLQVLYAVTGHLAISFSILGGLAMFLIIMATVGLFRLFTKSIPVWLLVAFLFFNPLLWLMSNSYMPDIMGLGLLMLCFYWFANAWLHGGKSLWWFCIATGLMLGVRLSYAPALFIPVAALWWRYRQLWLKQVGLQTLSVLVWLIPMVYLTGFTDLWQAATTQAQGHFTKWGGSVISSKASYSDRVISSLLTIWVDIMGGWWPGKKYHYVLLSPFIIIVLAMGFYGLWRWRKSVSTNDKSRVAWLLVTSVLLYTIWAFFGQNIVHKSRHLMPLAPFVCMVFAIGVYATAMFVKNGRWVAIVGIFLGIYITNTLILAWLHLKPTAISQIKDSMLQHNNPKTVFIGPNIMGYYLEKHYWDKGKVLDIETDTTALLTSYQRGDTLYSVEPLDRVLQAAPVAHYDFYHDPFVNRMWAHLTLYQYQQP